MPYANNAGIRIHYEVEGQGPPLVLHHGLNGYLGAWRVMGYVEPLREDYQVILMDSRGHGGSDKPHDPAAYALPLRVADVLAVLDDLGIQKAHYLGYSMGGWVGWGLAKHAPERFRSLIIGGYSAYGHLTADLVSSLYPDMATFMSISRGYYGPWWRPEYEAPFAANDLDALRAAATCLIPVPEVLDVLPAIAMPCLVFGGDRDGFLVRAEECVRLMPRATLLSFPGMGHVEAGCRPNLVLPHVRRLLDSLTPSDVL